MGSLAPEDTVKPARDSMLSNGSTVKERPPSYGEGGPPAELPPDLSLRLQNLNLQSDSHLGVPPSTDQLIAHLKFLEAVYKLREYIGEQENLFDIASVEGGDPTQQAKVLEKRWTVYVTRAVDRFEAWYMKFAPRSRNRIASVPLTVSQLTHDLNLDAVPKVHSYQLVQQQDLPPLDVLMVWHAYLLNPRCFLEDQFRFGRMDFYGAGFPWAAVDACIDARTFEFSAPKEARSKFEMMTGRFWDNLHDAATRSTICPKCKRPHDIPYTFNSGYGKGSSDFNSGNGYADSDLRYPCQGCGFVITHDSLRVAKFKNDVEMLVKKNAPLPGTVLSPNNGKPETFKPRRGVSAPPYSFPNQLILNGAFYMKIIDADALETPDDMRKMFEQAILDRSMVRAAKGSLASRLVGWEKVSIRRLMSRYWYNSSPFALDLVGAVLRQGSFIEKMHGLDWLNSPALLSTMERCLVKYKRFFSIMAGHPTKVAVPTLDVDLAWHTHQLMPPRYFQYSEDKTKKLIDHDDKSRNRSYLTRLPGLPRSIKRNTASHIPNVHVGTVKLFAESAANAIGRAFRSSNSVAGDKLHLDTPSDPLNSPHISAHNVVRDESKEASAKRRTTEARIDKAYNQAVARAQKKGRAPPRRDEYYSGYAWGYPVPYPLYYPYGVDPYVGGAGMYYADPCHVNTSSGAGGACASGTCGGLAAAGGGSCAGSAGGCGGGMAGCGGAGGGGGGCGGGGGGGGGCGGGGGGG